MKGRIQEWIGDDRIDVKIKGTSKWRINDCVALTYSKGNVFCLGDAVHRHPPQNGLGSNSCIQDAYNLAWKMAYVLKGQAKSSLLDTYTLERQPVGAHIVSRSNDSLHLQLAMWGILGMMEPDLDKRKEILAELDDEGPKGVEKRSALRKAFKATEYEHHALGAEMNQFYENTQGIYTKDEKVAGPPPFPEGKDPVLHHHASTYPGSRLPHAWLNTIVPGEQISTQDLAGKGRFTLFTGRSGKAAWTAAAQEVERSLGVEVKVWTIGWRQDYEDVFDEWESRREVGESGAVLVRPDRIVGWRSQEKDGAERLEVVVRSILGL